MADNVVSFKPSTGWCAAGGRHRWLPCWVDGDYQDRGEVWHFPTPIRIHGVRFWWCEVCEQRGMTTDAPDDQHPVLWDMWKSARWAVYAEADGTARLRVAAGVDTVSLDAKSARRLSRVLERADSRGREAAIALAGQDRWSAERAGDLVLVSRMSTLGREGLLLRQSSIRPGGIVHRCRRCDERVTADKAPTPVWRGSRESPEKMIWSPRSASAAAWWLFCVECVETMLGETEAIPLSLRGRAEVPRG